MWTQVRARVDDTPQRQVTQCSGERMPAPCQAPLDSTPARTPTNGGGGGVEHPAQRRHRGLGLPTLLLDEHVFESYRHERGDATKGMD